MDEIHQGSTMLQIARDNFEEFTKCQVEKAISACNLQAKAEYSSEPDFKQMMSPKSLSNYNVRVQDISNAGTIFCPFY